MTTFQKKDENSGSRWIRPTFLYWLLPCFIIAITLFCDGCSIQKIAVNRLGDALAQGGATFSSDNDPETVKAAVPFSLKLMESILAETPHHSGLLLALSSGFTQYAFAFVAQEADETEEYDLARAMELRSRALRLYLRGRDYGLRALDLRYPGLAEMINSEPEKAAERIGNKDVACVYWTAVSWAGAISLAKGDADMIADLPKVEALIDRALALDEAFNHGAIHSFLITYDMNRMSGSGDPEEKARKHFARAVELNQGQQAGAYVALAESLSLPKQDRVEFEHSLEQALSVDSDVKPEWRLANIVMQRRARWLLKRMDKLFVE
jgi:predicted anti-sigma-YlaC factor YlaD